MKTTKFFNIFFKMNLVLVLFLVSALGVSALGVSPASINLIEGQNYFSLTIHNNENLNIDVVLSVQGDDFLEFEQDSFSLSEFDSKKTVRVFIKNKEYDLLQRANIFVSESRGEDSMINVNLGLRVPVSLRVPSDEGFIEADIYLPDMKNQGVGYYILRLKNQGYGRIAQGTVNFKLNSVVQEQVFSLDGLASRDVSFFVFDSLEKGEHEVFFDVVYNDEVLSLSEKFVAGVPFLEVKDLIVNSYSDGVLSFNAVIEGDWPNTLANLNIVANTIDDSFESMSFALQPNRTESVPLFIRIKENEETQLFLKIQGQEHTYLVLIKDGVVFVDGVKKFSPFMKKQLNILFTIVILITLIALIVGLFSLMKNKTGKKIKKRKS